MVFPRGPRAIWTALVGIQGTGRMRSLPCHLVHAMTNVTQLASTNEFVPNRLGILVRGLDCLDARLATAGHGSASETRFIIQAGELEAFLEGLIRPLQILGRYAAARRWDRLTLAFRLISGHGRVTLLGNHIVSREKAKPEGQVVSGSHCLPTGSLCLLDLVLCQKLVYVSLNCRSNSAGAPSIHEQRTHANSDVSPLFWPPQQNLWASTGSGSCPSA